MGEVIDISIVSREYTLYKQVKQFIFQYCNDGCSVTRIEMMDNWEYKNVVELKNEADIIGNIHNKVIRIEMAGDRFVSGIFIEKMDDLYIVEGWLNPISVIPEKEYDDIIYKAADFFKNNKLIEVCGIGKEIDIDYTVGLIEAIKESYGVDIWLVSEIKYVVLEKQNYILIK